MSHFLEAASRDRSRALSYLSLLPSTGGERTANVPLVNDTASSTTLFPQTEDAGGIRSRSDDKILELWRGIYNSPRTNK